MTPVLVGLTSAVVFGAADFFGGLAARRITPLRATLVAATTGLIYMAIAAPIIGGTWSGEALTWGIASGASGCIAILLLYAALAVGPMSILSPLTAVVSAIIPLGWGLIQGERLSTVGYLALAIALVAVVLVGFVPGDEAVRPSARGIAYGVGSGILMGVYLSLLDQAPADSGLLPLLAHRGTSALILAVIVLVLVLGRSGRPATPLDVTQLGPAVPRTVRGAILIGICCGILDTSANVMILIGLRLGELSVVSVLVALYPAGTILLARVILKERIAAVQWVGLALAVIAAAALGSHADLSAALGLA